MTDKCPLCDSGRIGREWSRKIVLGRVSPLECAQNFGMTESQVYEHVNSHEIKVDEKTGDVSSPDYYMNKLVNMIQRMEGWINFTMEAEEFDVNRVRAATALIREIRETLKTLAEFQGARDSGNNYMIQINKIKMQYIELTEFIMEEACDECREKVINVMGMEPKLLSTT